MSEVSHMIMQKKSASKSKISQDEINQRLKMIKAVEDIESVKRDMSSGVSSKSATSTTPFSLQSLSGVGESDSEIFISVTSEYKELLQTIGNYAFAPELRPVYFKNNKIKSLLTILKLAGMTLQVRSVMDIFKDRVKQVNGGTIPTVTEKSGLFGKAVKRAMKIEEIASKFDVEVDIPPGADRPLTACGTQVGLLNHIREIVLEEEDVCNLLKKNARKSVARYLKAAGLLNFQTTNPDEKCLIATLVTPDAIQPKSPEDKDVLIKFRNILRKGKKWLDSRIEILQKGQEKNEKSA